MPKRSKRSKGAKDRYAKMTITIPRSLREAMHPYDAELNWSAIAVDAFRSRMALLNVAEFKGPEAHLIGYIEHVRRTVEVKLLTETKLRVGWESGVEWAIEKASDDQLRHFSRPSNEVFVSDNPLLDFLKTIEPRDADGTRAVEDLVATAPHRLATDDTFLKAFYDGAQSVWRRLESRLGKRK